MSEEGTVSILHWPLGYILAYQIKKGVCFSMWQNSTWKQSEVHLRLLQTPVEGKMRVKMKMTEEVVTEVDWCSHGRRGERNRELLFALFSLLTLFGLTALCRFSIHLSLSAADRQAKHFVPEAVVT